MPNDGPKSALELAMERLRKQDSDQGVVERALTDEQKAAIADVRKVHEAKVAEREILHRDARHKAKSHEELAKLDEELTQDVGRLGRDRDRKIAEIRERSD